jgi:hypothetical protein
MSSQASRNGISKLPSVLKSNGEQMNRNVPLMENDRFIAAFRPTAFLTGFFILFIKLWHIDPLLGNDLSNYTTVIAK